MMKKQLALGLLGMLAARCLLAVPPAGAVSDRDARARHLYEHGVYQEAAREVRQYLAANPDDFDAGKLLARILLRLGEYGELVTVGERLLRRRPDDRELQEMVDRARRERPPPEAPPVRRAETAADLEAALRRNPDNIGPRLRLIDIYSRAGQDRQAERHYRELLRRRPREIAYQLRFARFLARRGRGDEAEEFYLAALALEERPEIRREMFQVLLRPAEEMLAAGEADAALAHFREVAARHPDEPQLQLNYARLLSWADRPAEAIPAYRRYLEAEDDPAVRLEMARAISWAGDYAAARREVEAVLAAEPDNVAALALLGDIFRWTDNPDAARDHYERALALDPAHEAARTGLDELDKIAAQRAREEAFYNLAHMRTVAAESPGDERARLQLARLLAIETDYEAAAGHYRFYLDRHPDDLTVRLEYGRVLSSLGNLAGAATEFERYLAGNPGDLSTRAQLADLLLWQSEDERARRELETIIAENPRDIHARWNLARIHRDREEWTTAREHLAEIREINPGYQAAAAAIHEIETHPRYLVGRWEEQVAAEPGDIAARLRLARQLIALDRHHEAGAQLREILRRQPDHREAERLRQQSETRLAEFQAAQVAELAQRVREDPDDHESGLELARRLAAAGQAGEAISRYRHYLRARPDDNRARREYARLLSWQPEHQAAARREYETLLAEDPDDPELRVAHARLAAADRARWLQAEEQLRDIIALEPDRLDARLLLAGIYRDQGRYPEAREEYREVLDRDPASEEARDGLDIIRQRHRPRASLRAGHARDNDEYRERFVAFDYTHFLETGTALGLSLARHDFEQRDQPVAASARATRLAASVAGTINEQTSGRAWLGISSYDQRKESLFMGARADYRLDGRSTIGLEYARDDVIYEVKTVASLVEGIDADRLRLDWRREAAPGAVEWTEKTAFSAAVGHAAFSDGNRQTSFLAEALYPLRPEPSLELIVGWHSLGYRRESPHYWSPSSHGGPRLGARLRGDWELFTYTLEFRTTFAGGSGAQRALSGQLFRQFSEDLGAGLVLTFSETPREDDIRYRHSSAMVEVNTRF